MDQTTKICSKCKAVKILESDFDRRNDSKSKYKSHCKSCVSQYWSNKNNPVCEGPKQCNKCLEIKDHKEFYRRRNRADGLQPSCVICQSKYNKQYRSTNRQVLNTNSNKYARTTHGRFNRSKISARRHNIQWDILESQYVDLISKNICEYCTDHLNETGSGLDRINPTIGYILNNVVPSCHRCNTIKSNYFTYHEMKQIGILIKQIRTGRLLNGR